MFVLAREHITVSSCDSFRFGCSPKAWSGLPDCGCFESYAASREDHGQAP